MLKDPTQCLGLGSNKQPLGLNQALYQWATTPLDFISQMDSLCIDETNMDPNNQFNLLENGMSLKKLWTKFALISTNTGEKILQKKIQSDIISVT